MVTMKDVAQRAGVSPMTVSNVIHGNLKKVSAQTEAKVRKVMEEMNYIPNMSARGLASNSSRLIGFVYLHPNINADTLFQDPFNSEMTGALEQEIQKNQYFMMVYAAETAGNIVNLSSTWNVDGLVIIGATPKEIQELLEKNLKPMVFIDCHYDGGDPRYTNVGLDEIAAGYSVGCYLYKKGHRKIGYVTGARDTDEHYTNDGLRKIGCEYALWDCGMERKPLPSFAVGVTEKERKEGHARLREQVGEFTALFAASDYHAANMLLDFQEHGIRVPEDISIVGFDDNYFSRIVRPALTTVHQDVTQKAKIAVKQLLETIESGKTEGKCFNLSTKLMERSSVKEIKSNEKK